MRHEFVTIPTEKHGRQANILNVYTDSGPTFGSVFTKNPSLHNFAPRVGFAWVPFGERRPVIRGGAGIYYNEIMGRLYYQYARSGFLKTAQINNPNFPNPGLETVSAGNVSYSVWDPQPNTPTVYQYNFTVEQQIPWTQLSLSVTLVRRDGTGFAIVHRTRAFLSFWRTARRSIRRRGPASIRHSVIFARSLQIRMPHTTVSNCRSRDANRLGWYGRPVTHIRAQFRQRRPGERRTPRIQATSP